MTSLAYGEVGRLIANSTCMQLALFLHPDMPLRKSTRSEDGFLGERRTYMFKKRLSIEIYKR
jgi:hypothetical protein